MSSQHSQPKSEQTRRSRPLRDTRTMSKPQVASMIIRVPQENVIPLWKNSGKDGHFVWMEAQRASADLPEFMGLAWRLRWDKQIRLGARVGPPGLKEARRRFHNQDRKVQRQQQRSSTQDYLVHWTDTPLDDSTTALGCALDLVRWSWKLPGR